MFMENHLDSPEATVQPLSAMNLEETMNSVEPGQDYEVVVDFKPDSELDLQKFYTGSGRDGYLNPGG